MRGKRMRTVEGEMTKQEWAKPHIPVESSKLRVRFVGPSVLKTLIEACKDENDAFGAMGLVPEQNIIAGLRMVSGAQNDPNALAQSPVFNDVLQGRAPEVTYFVNGHKYDGPYYLADDIYPRGAARMFDVESLRSIMMTCIILHNMMVKNEYDYDAIDEYELDTMNNSRTQIYCAHDAT
ncbi:uncharacterized protein [Malus domestica]|uniref:uncharacterized protein n=1 Tax=Malus domestica TaxID=3750 RepID=UPI0039772433